MNVHAPHRPKVLVTVPNMGWVHSGVARVLLKLQADNRGYKLTFDFPSAVPFENNLNQIALRLLAGPWTWWLSIDADNPPRNNPLELIALDKDFIGLPTPVWHQKEASKFPLHWNAYRWDEAEQAYREWPRREGLQKVDAVGTGCFLAHRRVFEKIRAPFLRTWKEDGTVDLGNDMAFGRRAAAAGVEVYAHYGFTCSHHNEIDLNDVALSLKAMAQ